MSRTKQDISPCNDTEIARLIRQYVGDEPYKDVALRCGIDPSTLSYICRGKAKPGLETITRLAAHPRNGVTYNKMVAAMGITLEQEPTRSISLTQSEIELLNELLRLIDRVDVHELLGKLGGK